MWVFMVAFVVGGGVVVVWGVYLNIPGYLIALGLIVELLVAVASVLALSDPPLPDGDPGSGGTD